MIRNSILPLFFPIVINIFILQKLYDLGARRVLVTGTGPMGCVPSEIAQRGNNGDCSTEIQRAASLFNPQLETMLQGLNRKIGRDIFIAANTGKTHLNFIRNPGQYGNFSILLLDDLN
jgi:hypothetical protein